MAWWKSPVMPVSAVRNRLPKEWPISPPPLGKRYWKRRVSRSSSSARAAMQLRMSPGGRTPNSLRSRPEEPPSSVTVTTPASWHRRSVPTWCLSPRSNAERPVPPPIATRALPLPPPRDAAVAGSGEAEEVALVAVLAKLGEIGVVEGMDAILGIQLDCLGQGLDRVLQPVLDRVDAGREIRETLVLLVAASLLRDVERRFQVAAIPLVDRLEIRIGLRALGSLPFRRSALLAGGVQELPRLVAQIEAVGGLDRLFQVADGLLPILRLQGREPLGEVVESGIGHGRRRRGLLLRGGGRGWCRGLGLGLGHGNFQAPEDCQDRVSAS